MEENKSTQVATKSTFKSALVKVQDTYMEMVTSQMKDYHLDLTDYQRSCTLSAIAKINELLSNNAMTFNSIDQSNLGQILTTVATLKLNPSATPREVYFQTRKVKTDEKDSKGNFVYKTIIEMGIEGSGNDAILRNFGVDVKSVMTPFLIREGDEFEYPYFDGEVMQPIKWRMKSLSSKIKMVVYVITKKDGTRDYAMADRESVAENLKAHIINNLRDVDDETKNPILEKIENMTLDEMLNDLSLRKIKYQKKTWNESIKKWEYFEATKSVISPAWYQSSSREAMIERKMRNNAIKKYPKNFGSQLASVGYESTFEDYEQYNEKDSNKAKPNPIDAIDVEVNEKQGSTKANPILMADSSTNEEKLHSEAKNGQSEAVNDVEKEEFPY